MKYIENIYPDVTTIVVSRLRPFLNICKVVGNEEYCNIRLEYRPNKKLLDVASLRQYFYDNEPFNDTIEGIAQRVYKEIVRTIDPLYVKLHVYVENLPHIDWGVIIEKGEQK